MEIKKLNTVKVKCDLYGCNNMADYSIDLKRGIFGGTTDICKQCLTELYSLIAKNVIPNSPKNMFNKEKKLEEKRWANSVWTRPC